MVREAIGSLCVGIALVITILLYSFILTSDEECIAEH